MASDAQQEGFVDDWVFLAGRVAGNEKDCCVNAYFVIVDNVC